MARTTLSAARPRSSTGRFGAVMRETRNAIGRATAQPMAAARTAMRMVSSIGSIVSGTNDQLGLRSSARMSAPRVMLPAMAPMSRPIPNCSLTDAPGEDREGEQSGRNEE